MINQPSSAISRRAVPYTQPAVSPPKPETIKEVSTEKVVMTNPVALPTEVDPDLGYPNFRFEDVADHLLAETCVPTDLTAEQCERVFDSLVNTWANAKGYPICSGVHVSLVRTLMKKHGDNHLLLRCHLDASQHLDDMRDEHGPFDIVEDADLQDRIIRALQAFVMSSIAYGEGEEDHGEDKAELVSLMELWKM